MTDYPNVCVVTYPIGKSSVAVEDLLSILTSITSVSLLTAGVQEESQMPDEVNVDILSKSDGGNGVVSQAVRFVINQLLMANQLRKLEEEVVIFYGATSYVFPILVARLLGKKVVLEPRGNVPLSLKVSWRRRVPGVIASFLSQIVYAFERVGYWASTAIITYTPSMAQELSLLQYEDKLFTNGARFVDTERFNVESPFEDRDQVVGFIGRLDPEKRIPELAIAARELPSDIRFVFVGDGSYKEWLEEELAPEVRNGKVEIAGWVDHDEVPKQLNKLQLQIVPSHPTEGLPTAILEGMACGTPAYATPVSGVPDVVQDGETGFLMESVDGHTIAKQITEILKDEDMKQISQNCQELIDNQYRFEAAVERYESILADI